jgi:hypothetical protein
MGILQNDFSHPSLANLPDKEAMFQKHFAILQG